MASPHQSRMRALNLLDEAQALKTKATFLAEEHEASFEEIMTLLTLAHLASTMAQGYVALAELDS